ncbi:GTP-binding protein [Janthinobacterium sp. BJB1]|nr:GTP-binding protein [Janthinobacterium sp. BJB1]
MSIDNVAKSIKEQLDEQKRIQVRVALFGQPGAGKSSLINKILGRKAAEVGVETDKTVTAKSFEHNGIILVDLPGYGTKNFPKETYFEKFKIKEFDLFLCVSSGKLHQADTEFFHELLTLGKVCIFVVNKHDELWEDGVSITTLEKRKRDDIRKHAEHEVEVLFTSCRQSTGIDVLNETIRQNLDAAKQERWARGAKAYTLKFLDEKKKACEKYVSYAAAGSAANALNPVPGADVAVDLGILTKLFAEIRADFGLDDDFLATLKRSSLPAVSRLASNILQFATKEGLLLLLKRFAGRTAVKTLSKYIPFVGQAFAAGLGYAITSNAGSSYLDDCYQLAKEALENKLGT